MTDLPGTPGHYYWMPAAMDSGASLRYATRLKPGVRGSPVFKAQESASGSTVNVFKYRDQVAVGSFTQAPLELPEDFKHHAISSIDFARHMPGKLAFALINAVDAPKKKGAAGFTIREQLAKDYTIIQDSGGFQLASKPDVTFVDPVDVITSHNTWANLGVCLDVPPGPFDLDDKGFVRAASVHALNNEVFAQHAKEGMALINIVHGTSLARRKIYWDTVKHKAMNVICIGGLKSNFSDQGLQEVNIFAFAQHMAYTILLCGKQRYHLLGIGSVWQMLLAAVAARHFNVILTSDSSTWLQAARNGAGLSDNGSSNLLGVREARDSKTNNHSRLKCSCKFCSIVKYEYTAREMPWLLCSHNLATMAGWADQASNLAHYEDSVEWIHAVKKEFGSLTNQRLSDLRSAFDYIKSHASLKDFSTDRQTRKPPKQMLFGSAPARTSEMALKFEQIMQNYSDYHKVKL